MIETRVLGYDVARFSHLRGREINFGFSRCDLDLERAFECGKVLARIEKWLWHIGCSFPVVAQQEYTECDFHFVVCKPSARIRDESANLLRVSMYPTGKGGGMNKRGERKENRQKYSPWAGMLAYSELWIL